MKKKFGRVSVKSVKSVGPTDLTLTRPNFGGFGRQLSRCRLGQRLLCCACILTSCVALWRVSVCRWEGVPWDTLLAKQRPPLIFNIEVPKLERKRFNP